MSEKIIPITQKKRISIQQEIAESLEPDVEEVRKVAEEYLIFCIKSTDYFSIYL